MKKRSASLHAKYLIVLALAFAGGISYGCHAAWSLALGGGIQLVNLIVLERSARAVLATGGGGGRSVLLATISLSLRTVLFFAAVVYVLAFTSVQPLSFLAGLLAIVPAAVWHGLTPPAQQDR